MTTTYPQMDKLLTIARATIGYDERSDPCDNWTVFAGEVGHANCQPWCATWANAMFKRAGIWDLLPSHSAYTPTSFQGFKDKGQSISLSSTGLWRPGDVVYFKFPGLDRISHIGILEKVIDGDTIQDIEGNTNEAGSRTGGSVLRKARAKSMVAGIGRPKYTAVESAPAPVVPPWFVRGLTYFDGSDVARVRVKFGLPAAGGFSQDLAQKLIPWKKNKGLPATAVIDRATAIKIGA